MITQAPQDGFPPWPTCAKCRKPVDLMEWCEDYLTRMLVFRAHCHGEVEITELSQFQLMELRSMNQIEGGVAFRDKAVLPPATKELPCTTT